MHGEVSKDLVLLLKFCSKAAIGLESKGEVAWTRGLRESEATVLGVIREKGHCLN